ncbi:MAG: hypothetical protein Q8P41_13490 [Pseudomonadota bacterium]|nr:hypothetical protein [Pseudomonadota bacterium]
MRGFFGMVGMGLGAALLTSCGGTGADVTGSAGGVNFGKTKQVYFGGPFIVIAITEVDCEGLDFTRRNYEVGQVPTDFDVQLVQFAFEADNVAEGVFPVKIDAAVSATVVNVTGGAFFEAIATGGLLTVESVEADQSATGVFEGVLFDDGTLDGEFDATWCRNLKDR